LIRRSDAPVTLAHSFPGSTITELYWHAPSPARPKYRFWCETWWTLAHRSGNIPPWRDRSDSIPATGESISVLPSRSGLHQDIDFTLDRNLTKSIPTWHGISCQVGRVHMWLPVHGTAVLRPFSLLTLLPRHDPPDLLPFVLLGVQFLEEYKATVTLDCSKGSGRGRLIIP
jgi:hypothetical protein